MKEKRYLCSELLHLSGTGGWTGWANLEEIWRSGAILESETEIAKGQKVLIRKGGQKLWAAVVGNEPHDFGCRVELKFLFDQFWTPEVFEPEHLLDPEQVRAKPK